MEKEQQEETIKSFLGDLIFQTSAYAAALIFFTISYIGALSYRYGLINETFIDPAVGNLSLAAESLVTSFYTFGYNHSILFTFLFYSLVITTFILPIYKIIIFFIKRRRQKIKKEAHQTNGKIE